MWLGGYLQNFLAIALKATVLRSTLLRKYFLKTIRKTPVMTRLSTEFFASGFAGFRFSKLFHKRWPHRSKQAHLFFRSKNKNQKLGIRSHNKRPYVIPVAGTRYLGSVTKLFYTQLFTCLLDVELYQVCRS